MKKQFNVGDLVRSLSGDIGVVTRVDEALFAPAPLANRIRVMFHYGSYDLPKSNWEVVSESR